MYMMKTRITLSYDIVSPWSYFAFEVLKRYRPLWNFELVLDPVWLGGVMIASQNTPPFKVPNKQKKMNEEIPLMCKFFGVKCIMPEKFPFKSLQAARFLRVIGDKRASELENVTTKLFKAVFEGEMDAEDVERMTQTLIGDPFSAEEVQEFMEASKTTELKERVKSDAQRLVSQGAFGFPWIEVLTTDGHRLTIFGSDRFEFLAHWLKKPWKGPNPLADLPSSHL